MSWKGMSFYHSIDHDTNGFRGCHGSPIIPSLLASTITYTRSILNRLREPINAEADVGPVVKDNLESMGEITDVLKEEDFRRKLPSQICVFPRVFSYPG